MAMLVMALAHSKLTAQGTVSVPAEVCKKLGLGPGSVLEWYEEGQQICVRRVTYSSEDIHRALFGEHSPRPRKLRELKEGIRKHMRLKHVRD